MRGENGEDADLFAGKYRRGNLLGVQREEKRDLRQRRKGDNHSLRKTPSFATMEKARGFNLRRSKEKGGDR